jgi:hypothetical protein
VPPVISAGLVPRGEVVEDTCQGGERPGDQASSVGAGSLPDESRGAATGDPDAGQASPTPRFGSPDATRPVRLALVDDLTRSIREAYRAGDRTLVRLALHALMTLLEDRSDA